MRQPRRLSPRQLEARRWVTKIPFESYGVRAVVRVDDSTLVDEVKAHLPYGWRHTRTCGYEPSFSLVAHGRLAGGRIETWYAVYTPDGMTTQTPVLQGALDDLESRMQIYVAEMAHDWVFLHAGVVGFLGQAILLPGRSYAGKTTLVRELVRAGAMYYSDEYAVLDLNGIVHPFTRPLAIRDQDLRQTKHAVETLGGEPGSQPIPIGLVVLSSYRPRARWRPKTLSRGQGLLEVLNHAIPARRKPAQVLDTLERALANTRIIRAERSEARNVTSRILALMEY